MPKSEKTAGSDEIMYLLHCSCNNSKLYIIMSVFRLFNFPSFFLCIQPQDADSTSLHCLSQPCFPNTSFSPFPASLFTGSGRLLAGQATENQPQNCLQITCNSGEKQTFFLTLTGKTQLCPFLDVVRPRIFSSYPPLPLQRHTSHNRKFFMHYKFGKNGQTIILHIHEEVVNSCSLKLKVNQVDFRVTAGQRFFLWRSFSQKSQASIIFSAQ